jgi:hypothetical protein
VQFNFLSAVFDTMNIPGKKTNAEPPTEDETTRSQIYNRVTHQQEEEIRIQRELIIWESLMYEQLERAAAAAAKATATAASFKIIIEVYFKSCRIYSM